MASAVSMDKTIVLDSSFLIAYCAKETGRFETATSELARFADEKRALFAPAVAATESLFALCRKLYEGALTPAEHTSAIETLVLLLSCVHLHPDGDFLLTERAEQIRAGYGCSRSADGIFIALCEELTRHGQSEIATFDESLHLQAARNAPTVVVHTLS